MAVILVVKIAVLYIVAVVEAAAVVMVNIVDPFNPERQRKAESRKKQKDLSYGFAGGERLSDLDQEGGSGEPKLLTNQPIKALPLLPGWIVDNPSF